MVVELPCQIACATRSVLNWHTFHVGYDPDRHPPSQAIHVSRRVTGRRRARDIQLIKQPLPRWTALGWNCLPPTGGPVRV